MSFEFNERLPRSQNRTLYKAQELIKAGEFKQAVEELDALTAHYEQLADITRNAAAEALAAWTRAGGGK